MVSLARLRGDRRYYKRNKEAVNCRCRAYYAAHSAELAEKQRARRRETQKRGDVCAILKTHAKDVADDPDRLSSDFILEQVELLSSSTDTPSDR